MKNVRVFFTKTLEVFNTKAHLVFHSLFHTSNVLDKSGVSIKTLICALKRHQYRFYCIFQ